MAAPLFFYVQRLGFCALSGKSGADSDNKWHGGPVLLLSERFRAKWMPVRVKKTRQNKKPEHDGLRSCSDRHKISKRSIAGLSKAALRWYIPLAPKGICSGIAFSGSLRTGLIGALGRGPDSFRFRFFSKARNGLSRGGAAR
jgi:hypothetical protein